MSDFYGARVRVGGATGMPGGGVTSGEVDAAIAAAIDALDIPTDVSDLTDTTGIIPPDPAAITITTNSSYSIGDAVNVIATGNKFGFKVKFAGTITGWDIGSDVSTTSSVQVWQRAAGSYPPTSGQTVLTMTLTADTENSATGLSIAFSANDWFFFNVSANDNAKWLGPCLVIERSVGP